MLQKNTNIFIIIGGGVIYDEFSIYRDKIHAYSSRDYKSFRYKRSYNLQAYQFGRVESYKSEFKKNYDKSQRD